MGTGDGGGSGAGGPARRWGKAEVCLALLCLLLVWGLLVVWNWDAGGGSDPGASGETAARSRGEFHEQPRPLRFTVPPRHRGLYLDNLWIGVEWWEEPGLAASDALGSSHRVIWAQEVMIGLNPEIGMGTEVLYPGGPVICARGERAAGAAGGGGMEAAPDPPPLVFTYWDCVRVGRDKPVILDRVTGTIITPDGVLYY